MKGLFFTLTFLVSLQLQAATSLPIADTEKDQNIQRVVLNGSGVDSKDQLARSTVLIMRTEQGQIVDLCTGSVLGRKLILTAAHCVEDETNVKVAANDLHVSFGNLPLQSESLPKTVVVQNFQVHPGFTRNLNKPSENDFAILKLRNDLPPVMQPIRFLSPRMSLPIGSDVLIAGYGLSNLDITDWSHAGVLHQYRGYQVATNRSCSPRDGVELKGPDQNGSYYGDSGGPAYLERDGELYLFGVLSKASTFGATACYEDVRSVSSWIRKMMTEL